MFENDLFYSLWMMKPTLQSNSYTLFENPVVIYRCLVVTQQPSTLPQPQAILQMELSFLRLLDVIIWSQGGLTF